MAEERVVVVFDYFAKVGVAAVKLSGVLAVGDRIRIKGATTDFEMKLGGMQIDRTPVEEAAAGQSIGIKVPEKVRPHDVVYRILG